MILENLEFIVYLMKKDSQDLQIILLVVQHLKKLKEKLMLKIYL